MSRHHDELAGHAFTWSGRVDEDAAGDTRRWHQVVRPFRRDAAAGVALLGFASEEGVRRNGGRPGAAQGPEAIRRALCNLPLCGEPALYDGGDVRCADGDLDGAQRRLAHRVNEVLNAGSFPLVLGGGHEVAWGTFQGLADALPRKRILVLNFDAHFDLRAGTEGTSGTPFRQIADWCEREGQLFRYHVLGISTFANTGALFARAQASGVKWREDEALQSQAQVGEAIDELREAIDAVDALHLSLCLDVLPAAVAPGVSAPAALGVPLAQVERILDAALASGKVRVAEIAECNPLLDADGATARVAARLAARIARKAAPLP